MEGKIFKFYKKKITLQLKMVEKNGNKNVTIIELENLNHLFQEADTNNLSEYSEIEQTISPVALEQISGWIHEQVK